MTSNCFDPSFLLSLRREFLWATYSQVATGHYEMGVFLVSMKLLSMLKNGNRAPKRGYKRIMLITDEDDPHPGARAAQLTKSARTNLIVCFSFLVQHWTRETVAEYI